MSIKNTRKYTLAVSAARDLLVGVPAHKTADELYQQLEAVAYWDVDDGWVKNPDIDPLKAMDKNLIRVRITAHLDHLEHTARKVIARLGQGFEFSEASKVYPNVRDADGAGRIYLTFRIGEGASSDQDDSAPAA